MNAPAGHRPLDDAELDRLSDCLDAHAGAMNVDSLDGYLAALMCAPTLVSTSMW